MSPEPTHHVIHTEWRLDAYIYIAESLQEKLDSGNPSLRHRAEAAVAISFREACFKRHGVVLRTYVEYTDLEFIEINRTSELVFIPLSPNGDPLESEDDWEYSRN